METLRVVVLGLVIVGALLHPAVVSADSRVRLKAQVEPTYPVAGEELSLRAQISDASGHPLDKAQVVATVWMDSGPNPNMAMTHGSDASDPLRLVGRPQRAPGEYLFAFQPPMSGRWRAQIWVNSSGATGSLPLNFDVVAQAPPEGVNWLLVSLSWAVMVIGSVIVWRRALGQRQSSALPNLLEIAPLRGFLRSRWYPAVLQWPTLAIFALITYLLLAGTYEAHDNVGSALTWIVWWPLLPLVFLLFGRLWCAVCPMSLVSDLSQRFVGRRLPVPLSIKRRSPWLVLGAFLAITWADLVLRLVEVPSHTAVLLLAVAAGVVFCGLVFERRTWCRYLCPIGGLSGNYAMAAAVELRADEITCRNCHSFACVRGDGRTTGCPMFEFPRTMSSNHHCNLCGNCIKTCPNDALRLSPRVPAEELVFRRRARSEEAILAATLLGVVAMQSVVMLGPSFPLLSGWLGGGHGDGNALALTAVFVALTALPLAMLRLASLLSEWLAGESSAGDLVRFAYVLIPLGLTAHLAHNLNHLLGEGRSVRNAALKLFGQPAYAVPVLESPDTIKLLQYSLILGGAMIALALAWRLSSANCLGSGSAIPSSRITNAVTSRKRTFATLPYQTLVAMLAAGLLLLFGQNMAPRLQLSAEAHDQVRPTQIDEAKASVASFVGRTIPLEYVHLEEHGYRDIILRNGETYYFVDISEHAGQFHVHVALSCRCAQSHAQGHRSGNCARFCLAALSQLHQIWPAASHRARGA